MTSGNGRRAASPRRRSEGSGFGLGGAASTAFWVDPVEALTMVFLTQLLPSRTYPIRSAIDTLVHQALVD